MLPLTVAVTHPVDELNVWLENGTHADPVHHEIDWPPAPRRSTVMVTEEKSVPVADFDVVEHAGSARHGATVVGLLAYWDTGEAPTPEPLAEVAEGEPGRAAVAVPVGLVEDPPACLRCAGQCGG